MPLLHHTVPGLSPLAAVTRRWRSGGLRNGRAWAESPTGLIRWVTSTLLFPLAVMAGTGPAGAQSGGEIAQPADQAFRVEFSQGLLSVKARDVRLQDLLNEVARHSGIELRLYAPLDERVTRSFNELGLPQAIDRLLRGKSYTLQQAGDGSASMSSTLWVFGQGSRVGSELALELPRVATSPEDAFGNRLEVVAALAETGDEPDTAALASAIVDRSISVRYEAVHVLGEIGGATSTGLLEQALQDADTNIRTASIDALAEIGGEDSARALALALNDADPAVRENAVYALGDIGGATATELIEQAARDPDALVREVADEILSELEGGY